MKHLCVSKLSPQEHRAGKEQGAVETRKLESGAHPEGNLRHPEMSENGRCDVDVMCAAALAPTSPLLRKL